jgi:hypothetical protein
MNYIKVIVPFLWIGFVAAISFMEAWLKFTAPGVTLTIGLGIGQVIFKALNHVEIIFAVTLLMTVVMSRQLHWKSDSFLFMAIVVLFIQSIWLLPGLSTRVDAHLQGITPPPSNLHFYFLKAEILKVILLIVYGIKQLQLWKISITAHWAKS